MAVADAVEVAANECGSRNASCGFCNAYDTCGVEMAMADEEAAVAIAPKPLPA